MYFTWWIWGDNPHSDDISVSWKDATQELEYKMNAFYVEKCTGHVDCQNTNITTMCPRNSGCEYTLGLLWILLWTRGSSYGVWWVYDCFYMQSRSLWIVMWLRLCAVWVLISQQKAIASVTRIIQGQSEDKFIKLMSCAQVFCGRTLIFSEGTCW